MTAAVARKGGEPTARPSALAVFIARAEARAMLWQLGEISLHDAIDELQTVAECDGLIPQLGTDKVQEIIADAFAPVRGDLVAANLAGRVRPLVADRSRSTKERTRFLWAAAKAANHLAADDVRTAFMALAVETDLIDQRGRWTGVDVREGVRRHGAEDVEHVIEWALRGWNPFEKGSLK